MSTTTTVKCDVCGEVVIGSNGQTNIPVAFITEQTEGRPVSPYLSYERIDICSECFKRFVNELPLRGAGAMGANSYFWQTGKA